VRIALVGPAHPYKGGIAQYTTALAHQLTAAGHEVRLESWSHQYPARLYPGQLTVAEPELPVHPGTLRRLSWRRPDGWYRAGRRLRGCDLVVLVVVTPVQMPAYLGILAGLGRRRSARVVAECHNVLPHERRRVDVALMRAVLSRVDGVLVHSAEQGELAGTLTSRRVVVQPMAPLLVSGAAGAPPAPLSGVQNRLLFFGLVRPYKGLDVLLRALAAGPPQVRLRVAGEFWGGSQATEALVGELGLGGRVELLPGYVDAAKVSALFADVDALVLPYRSATATFNPYLAFKHGVPVIATRVGTIGEDIHDGVDGIVCEPDDVASLARALDRFYAEGMPAKLRAAVPPVDAAAGWAQYLSGLTAAAGPCG
jgi:glycosyltransferase involved in cell wall biosynthesis